MTDHELQTEVANVIQTRRDAESKLLEIGREANAREVLHEAIRKIGIAGERKLWPTFLELAMDNSQTAKDVFILGLNALIRAQTISHCDTLAALTSSRN